MTYWSWILTRIVRQIWFRAAVISVLSIALAVLAAVIGPFLPYSFDVEIGQRSVGTILQIMASSMLAVTTFSLTAMVSAYSSATQLATPRATQLMVSDPKSQNALSTFLGAFVFAMVGIIGLNTSAYGQTGRIILFAATVVIILLVVVTLLRWIGHIAAFGRMADVIDRVERAAVRAMRLHATRPYLCGSPAVAVPSTAAPVCSAATGYVTHIDMKALGLLAERHGFVVHVPVLPGAMVHPTRPLLHVEGAIDDDLSDRMIEAFTIERHRSFDQDPRLGLIGLSEIATRAMSPAVNDPGTAIEVLNALLRAFLTLRERGDDGQAEDRRSAVHVGEVDPADMLADAFGPIIREGSGTLEVSLRLTATLDALRSGLPQMTALVRPMAARHRDMVLQTMKDKADVATFVAAYDCLWERPLLSDG